MHLFDGKKMGETVKISPIRLLMLCEVIYLVTFSSHFTIDSMIVIEIRQNPAKTAHVIHWLGKLLSIVTPSAMNRFPMAVAVSHKPWQMPWRCCGATLDTNESPSGEMNSSATVRKKYVTMSTYGLDFIAIFAASASPLNSSPEG